MRRIILFALGIIILSILGLFLYTSNKFQSLNERYVKIIPGKEERVVLVNIGEGNRRYFAEKIKEISACGPKVIGVDLFFKEFSADSELDKLLMESIEQSNCILATKHEGIGTHGVHKKYLEAATDYGYAELDIKDKFAAEFQVFRDGVTKRDYHFAYQLANEFDSIAASDFIQSLSGNRSNIVISRLTNQFRIFDFEEIIDCAAVQNKIVIMGYLGPTYEDKFTTYARYHDQSDEDGPDMYGPVIVANQVLMMIDQ